MTKNSDHQIAGAASRLPPHAESAAVERLPLTGIDPKFREAVREGLTASQNRVYVTQAEFDAALDSHDP